MPQGSYDIPGVEADLGPACMAQLQPFCNARHSEQLLHAREEDVSSVSDDKRADSLWRWVGQYSIHLWYIGHDNRCCAGCMSWAAYAEAAVVWFWVSN